MKTILIGERYRQKLEIPLISSGFEPIWLPENPNIDIRLAFHTDLSVFKYKKKIILASYFTKDHSLVRFLTSKGYEIDISNQPQYPKYPEDINLCAAIIGNRIIHNIEFTDPKILSIGLDHIRVKQGYSRCTALTLDELGLITADSGIAVAAEKEGIEVLLINEGGIELDGFNIGFIGGASFIAEDTIYFTGDIETHPDVQNIKAFIFKHGYKICSLTDGPLVDIGGAVYIE